jgi:cobalt-zinc-cadmium efflux system membrane fusion protein
MNRLLILLLAALLWALAPALMAQDKHDHGKHAQQTTPKEKDKHEGHDHGEHDENEEAGHEEDGHEGHDHEDEADHADEGIIEITPEAVKMAGIKLADVSRGTIGKYIDLPGEVGFNEDRLAHIAPRFAGITKEARFRVGDYVREGDVVAVIESNESMSEYSIEAPISGWIIKKHATPGEYVSGENNIYVIVDLSNVWVNLAVYPQDAEWVKPGLKVHIKAIGSESRTEGTIEYITPVLDAATRSLTARVVLPNPDGSWRPGTFVHGSVTTESGQEGLVVEKNAVQILDDEQIVFVSEGPGRFKPVPVVSGESDSNFVKILSGLEQGMKYVAKGAFELKAKIVTSSLSGHAGHGH